MTQHRHEDGQGTAGATIGERVGRARQLFARAKEERFAVLAFNADSQDVVLAVARAAAAKRAPVLIAANNDAIGAIGAANLRTMVDGYNDELGTEIYLNLDRAPSVAAAKAAIDAGFEFVHLDLGSSDPNATDDATVLDDRHETEPAPDIDLDLLEQIHIATDVTISLHGDRSTPGHLFTRAARMGAGKINLHTELQHPYRATLELQLRMHVEEPAVVRLMRPVIAAVQRAAEDHIQLFGVVGKATA